MTRFLIVISVCVFFVLVNGIWGLALAWVILAVLGAFWPVKCEDVRMPSDADDRVWEKIEPARRGSNVDPTRPDDHPLLLTNEIRRQR